MTLTAKQQEAISRTNKYGVIYGIHPSTAASLIAKGLLDTHTNYYGNTTGFKLTSPDGFAEKRRITRKDK